jgi:hypothetical protein
VPQATFGVGHNPDSIPSVFGTDGASWNNKRPAGVAFAFQVRKHSVELHVDDSRHVFNKHPTGSCFRNNAEHLRPDRTVICRASALPGETEWLARKSSCEQVNPQVVGSSQGEDVGVERWRPTLFSFA